MGRFFFLLGSLGSIFLFRVVGCCKQFLPLKAFFCFFLNLSFPSSDVFFFRGRNIGFNELKVIVLGVAKTL